MDSSLLIGRLNNNIKVFRSLFEQLDNQQIRWKPHQEKWSIMEVIHHLYDEEREDFRLRLEYTLSDPKKEWIPINQHKWVVDRKYNEQNFLKISNSFITERKDSVKWLNNLKSPQWNNTYNHPKIGKISAGDLLTSWLSHDFLHLRQLILLNLEYYKILSSPFDSKYASPQF